MILCTVLDMLIGNVQCGNRIGLGVADQEQSRFSMGVSMAGDVTTDDYTLPYTDIVLTFPMLNDPTKDALKSYLFGNVKQGGTVVVTPDGSDNMQVGRNLPTAFIFQKLHFTYVSSNIWRTELYLRFVGINLGARFALAGDDIVEHA